MIAMEIGLFQLENLTMMPAAQFAFLDVRRARVPVDPHVEALLKKALPLKAEEVVAHLAKSDKGAPVVLVCENGKTSAETARRLDAAGFTNLYVVTGGVEGLLSEL